MSQRSAQLEQFVSELRVAVQSKQNSPSDKVTVLAVEENGLPPLVPLHSYVGLIPSAEHVSTSPASYGEASDGVMVTPGGQSADRVVIVLLYYFEFLTSICLFIIQHLQCSDDD